MGKTSTCREKVRAAFSHTSGRIPIDFGGTPTSGMHVSCVAALRDYYGLPKKPVTVHEPYQMLGWLDDDLKSAMGIDVEAVFPRNTLFGFPNEGWKTWRMYDGLEVAVPAGFKTKVDASGDTLIYPQGDTQAPPSGRMPKDGYFFDTIIRQDPIDEEKLNPEDNLEEFKPLSDVEIASFAKGARTAAASGRAVIATLPGTAFGDIALVPAPFLKHPRGIRDIEEWYVSIVARRDYVNAVFSKQSKIALANLERLHAAAGDLLDAVFVCGTDFGTQSSRFCSVETFRELYLPYYKMVNDWIHTHTTWKTFKHSCGAVEPLISSFIDAGFDILNPVQCSAAGMDPAHLKATHGDRIVFWGGGVDTQHVLPFGTEGEVRDQVTQRCRIFSENGGFVFNSIHNVQARTPIKNIIAMIEAVHRFNR